MCEPSATACRLLALLLVICVSVFLSFALLSPTLAPPFHYVDPSTILGKYFTPPTQATDRDANLLDVWQASWADHRLLSTSPLGDFLPGVLERITALQNPPSCSAASFLIFEYRSALGFGAVAKHFVVALHAAIQTGRVLIIDQSGPFYWTEGCPERTNDARHECYFRPLSETCTYASVMRLVNNNKLPLITLSSIPSSNQTHWPFIPPARKQAPNVVRFRQPKLENLFGDFLHGYTENNTVPDAIRNTLINLPAHTKSKYLTPDPNARRSWLIALAFYFLRLNAKTASDVRTQIQSLLNTSHPVHERFIGLPIRASDKCYGNNLNEPGEMRCVPLAEVIHKAHLLALGESTITKAIITSEDPSAITPDKIEQAQRNITFHDPLEIVFNTLDDPAGTGSPRRRISSSSNAKLLKASLVTLHLQSQACVIVYPLLLLLRVWYRPTLETDHLVVVSVLLRSAFHILSPRSTFSSLIAAFAKTVPGKRHHTFYAIGEQSDLKGSLSSQFM